MEETAESLSLEPERYELQAEIRQQWETGRREFFDFAGAGIVVVYALDQVPTVTESGGRRGGPGLSLPQEIGSWLHISGEDGTVTAYTGKVEVGQGIRTTLTEIIADELPVPRDSIRLVMADTDLTPFDFGTVGSRTTPIMAPQIRKLAGAGRDALLDLAARYGGGTAADYSFRKSQVVHRETGRAFTVAALASRQTLLVTVGEDAPAKAPSEWRVGRTDVGDGPAPRVNGRALVTGGHRYTSDLKTAGMLYGKVLRAPSANARRVSLDLSGAEALPGVRAVHDPDFAGIVARDPETAERALAAIRAEWQPAEDQPSSETLYEYLRTHPAPPPAYSTPTAHVVGSVAEGFAASAQVLESRYTIAYIAHAPPEPRAALAEWTVENGQSKLTVRTGTQRPFGVRGELATVFGLSEDHIRVIVPDTGSGYGGKHTGDAAIEAARLSRAVGRPVKLVWTREEEFAHAYFRPAGVIDIRSGIDKDGSLLAWECHNYNSGSAGIRTLYDVPHQHIDFHPSLSPLRQGSYRALAATANHFARESHMDELAHAAKTDPLAFRLRNLTDPRLRTVLRAAADRFDWETYKSAPGRGAGIAGGHEKGSYVATCAEVSVDPKTGAVKVIRAVTAFECGAILHADNVRNQVDGAVIQGLGGALFEQIEFADGTVVNGRFSAYRLPRFRDVPDLETVLLHRPDLPSVGAGETPIVAIAPAVGNALFAATGVRRRSLPLAPETPVPAPSD